ncbi:MAG: CHAP domain-containing protein, partial [Enterococcus faecalis]|nr:CHAP domain-containing protein [Enterococcus faecalis]
MLKKLITCTLLSSIALTGVNMLEYSPKIDQNHIAKAAEIDKYPRPIKKQQPNYHTKNNCTWYVHNKRNQTKRYLPSSFTDAKNWLNEAKRAGFATG